MSAGARAARRQNVMLTQMPPPYITLSRCVHPGHFCGNILGKVQVGRQLCTQASHRGGWNRNQTEIQEPISEKIFAVLPENNDKLKDVFAKTDKKKQFEFAGIRERLEQPHDQTAIGPASVPVLPHGEINGHSSCRVFHSVRDRIPRIFAVHFLSLAVAKQYELSFNCRVETFFPLAPLTSKTVQMLG